MDDSALDHLLEEHSEHSNENTNDSTSNAAVMKRKLDAYVNGDDRSQSPSEMQKSKLAKLDHDLVDEPECSGQSLPDHLRADLDIVIVGINPGTASAAAGHHYAGGNNHFWPLMHECGFTCEQFPPERDGELPGLGIGLTNLVHRTTASSAQLTRDEMKAGAESLRLKLQKLRPKIVCFNGKEIYRIFSGVSDFHLGRQPSAMHGGHSLLYVLPSSSARCSQWPRAADKRPYYEGLRKLRDLVTGKLAAVHDSEVVFPDTQLRCDSADVMMALGAYDDDNDAHMHGNGTHDHLLTDSNDSNGADETVTPYVNGDSGENSNNGLGLGAAALGPVSSEAISENGAHNDLRSDGHHQAQHDVDSAVLDDMLQADTNLPQDFMKSQSDDSQDATAEAENLAAQQALEAVTADDKGDKDGEAADSAETDCAAAAIDDEAALASAALVPDADESFEPVVQQVTTAVLHGGNGAMPREDNTTAVASQQPAPSQTVVSSAGEFDKLLSEAMHKEMQCLRQAQPVQQSLNVPVAIISALNVPDPLDMAIKEENVTADDSFDTSTASVHGSSLPDSSVLNSSYAVVSVPIKVEDVMPVPQPVVVVDAPLLTKSGKVRTPEMLVIEKHIAESVAAVVQRCRDGTQILPEHYIRPSTPPATKHVAAPPPQQVQAQPQPPPAHQQHRNTQQQQQQGNRVRPSHQQHQQQQNQQQQQHSQQQQQQRQQNNSNSNQQAQQHQQQQPQQQQQHHNQQQQHQQQNQQQNNQQQQSANNITNLAANQLLTTIYGAAVGQQQQQQRQQQSSNTNTTANNNAAAGTNNPLDYLNYFQQATAAPAGYDQLQRAMQQVAGNYQQQAAGWPGGLYDAFFQNNQQQPQQANQQSTNNTAQQQQQQTAFRAAGGGQQQQQQPQQQATAAAAAAQQQNTLPQDFYNYFGSNQNF